MHGNSASIVVVPSFSEQPYSLESHQEPVADFLRMNRTLCWLVVVNCFRVH